MKYKRIVKILIISLLLLSASAETCLAGFGVSPPWVRNYNLLPGSHFEQTIILSRGEPKESLKAKVIMKVPDEIRNWISIDKGLSFTLPKGQQQVPMKVIVDVPENARLGEYRGSINVETVPEEKGGTVSVALAAGIDVDLIVTEKEMEGMIVRFVGIKNVEEDSPIKLLMRIENTGNVKTRPDRVYIEIYGPSRHNILATGQSEDLDWIGPFQTKEITASFPNVRLKLGQYWANVKIFKGEKILRSDKIIFEVVKKKPLPLVKFAGKKNIIIYLGLGILFFIAIILIIWAERKRRYLSEKK